MKLHRRYDTIPTICTCDRTCYQSTAIDITIRSHVLNGIQSTLINSLDITLLR